MPPKTQPLGHKWDTPRRSGYIDTYLGLTEEDVKQISRNPSFKKIWDLYFEISVRPDKAEAYKAGERRQRDVNFTTLEDMVEDPIGNHLNEEQPQFTKQYDRTHWAAWTLYKLCELEKVTGFLQNDKITDHQRRCMIWSLMDCHAWEEYGKVIIREKEAAKQAEKERKRAIRERIRERKRAAKEAQKLKEKEEKQAQKLKAKEEKEAQKTKEKAEKQAAKAMKRGREDETVEQESKKAQIED